MESSIYFRRRVAVHEVCAVCEANGVGSQKFPVVVYETGVLTSCVTCPLLAVSRPAAI